MGHTRVPVRSLHGADGSRRAQDSRSARSRSSRVVGGQGRRDISPDPRLRRLPRQGQFGRAAGPAGLSSDPRRRGEHAGRGAAATRGRRDLARLRLLLVGQGPRQAGVRRVQAARRQVRQQRHRAGEERPDRLPAARALLPIVRRDAPNAPRDGGRDHQGVSRLQHPPRLSRDDVGGGAEKPDGAASSQFDRRRFAERHGGRCQHRQRPQLERVAVRSGELVRVRQARLEPASRSAIDCRRVDANDLEQRPARGEHRRRHDDGVTPGGRELHDPARPRAPDGHGPSLRAGAVGQRPEAARVESDLLQSRRHQRDRLRPDGERERSGRAICPAGCATVLELADCGRRLFAVVPPRAVGHAARYRAKRLGRAACPL